MAPVKVHGIPRSTCTMRVLAALSEKEADYELVMVNLMKGEHKQPPFLALQPFGVIPVIQDEDLTLFESRAIARYVADKYQNQGSSLYGESVTERALIEQGIEMEAQNFTPAGQPIFYQMVIAPMRGTPTNEAVVEESLIKFAKVLDIHEERLAKAPYLGGESFSLADLTHMPLTHYLIGLPKVSDVFRARKNVMAWWERISSREAWKKVTALSA